MGKQLSYLPLRCFSKIPTGCGLLLELGLDCEPNLEGRSVSVLNLNQICSLCFTALRMLI